MKKRTRSRRQHSKSKGGSSWLGGPAKPAKRERRAWTFERLEERYYLTASPLAGLAGVPSYGVSNSTADGQQLIDAIQQSWYSQMTGVGGQSGVESVALSVPTDPYLNYQWHLFNVGQVVNPGQFQDLYGLPGQDINVIPAWDLGYTGAGVNVAVVDTGVQLNHPDLIANLGPGYDAIRNRPGGGPQGDDPHGTAVAGLLAASANNGIGGAGVAYGATIIPIRFLGVGSNEQSFLNAIGAGGAPIDVYNHSWGYFNGRSVVGLSTDQLIALTNSARLGRGGLGAIHVFAAGNFAESSYSAGSSALVNSRYTIGVGIVDHDGKVPNSDGTSTSYGNLAPSVLIVAPSASGPTDIINNFATGSGLFTTDQEPGGYNVPPVGGVDLDIDTFPDTLYTSRMGGTSGAAPLVSGVVALMLEANPNLSYRDVQEILVRSARQNDDLDESWITNLVPLFRDPFGHNPFPDNYPIDPDHPLYPSDESQWNDEIVYQLVPGMPMDPAVQATTGPVSATNSDFTVTAVADNPWDGWVANNLTVVFRTEPGDMPEALAQIIEGKIRVTVTGDGVTWGEIKDAIELLGQPDPMNPDPALSWFEVAASNEAGVFDPTDEAIQAPLTGGVDATGREMTLERNPQYQGYHPIADPIINPEPLSLFTNGAGFTVSHGRDGALEYGWAHGVVNAALAVQLAKQWHLKDQNLPPEKTWVTAADFTVPIRAKQITDEMSGEYVIPGALSYSTEGFAEYFNEFFKDVTITAGEDGDPDADPPVDPTADSIDPMSLPFNEDDPPVNTRGNFLTFNVPAVDPVLGGSNLMSMEWVEVHLNITGDANAMNYLRITLVSPDGTHSELTLNQYQPEDVIHNFQSMASGGLLQGLGDSITPVDENGTQTDTLDWVYSTNRIWGERSDTKPVFDEYGNLVDLKGWELHFENYSGTDLQYNGVQIAFHGSPVGSPAGPVERVLGKVGVDAGRFIQSQNQIVGALDGEFNFDRYVTVTSNNSHAFTSPSGFFGGTTPFGDHEIRVADPLQEQFAGNITVYAIDNASGLRVAEFLTGYDGNYYFDLPEGEYTLGIEDPLGRDALDNVDGHRNYDNEWVITIDTSDDFYRTAGEIDAISGKLNLFDDLNFLLDPGSLPPSEVVFSGRVVGDLNGNGVQDVQDTGVYNFVVYADLNHTGKFEIGETFTTTDVNGYYTLPVATATPNTFTIGVKAPTGWTPTSPPTGFLSEYALPGEAVDGFDFLFTPPTTPSGEGNGTIFGFLFDDKNGNGLQDINEKGVPNFTVFIDANENGKLDSGEISAITSATGAYQFGEVILGTVRIDVVVDEPYILTSPLVVGDEDGYIERTLVPGQVSKDNIFGVRNLATDDYGDLVGVGFKTSGPDAARHAVGGFTLGTTVDAEIRPSNLMLDEENSTPENPVYVEDPALNGIGDDQQISAASFDDEEGVVLVGGVLRPGSNLLDITLVGVGGYLQGWIDFNNDGTFGAGERVFTNLDLVQGLHRLTVEAPQDLVAGQYAARFRWGPIDTDYFGPAIFGEVEDYLFTAKVPILGDYNADDVVDDADYALWKSTYGSTIDLRADGNNDGMVDSADYTVWRDNMGAGSGGGSGAVALAGGASSSQQAAAEPALTHSAQLSALPVAPLTPLGSPTTVNGAAPDAASVVGGGSIAIGRGESPASSLNRVEQALPRSLAELHFSASVGHSLDSAVVQRRASASANRADLAMLLVASSNFHRERSASHDDAFAADANWLNDDHAEHAELDLALAAAFEDEVDWRHAL